MNSSSISYARNGKIARLPHALREQLNHRLRDHQPAKPSSPGSMIFPRLKRSLRPNFSPAQSANKTSPNGGEAASANGSSSNNPSNQPMTSKPPMRSPIRFSRSFYRVCCLDLSNRRSNPVKAFPPQSK